MSLQLPVGAPSARHPVLVTAHSDSNSPHSTQTPYKHQMHLLVFLHHHIPHLSYLSHLTSFSTPF